MMNIEYNKINGKKILMVDNNKEDGKRKIYEWIESNILKDK